MIPLFVGLTCLNFIALAVAMTFGYLRTGPDETASRHMLSGVLAAMVCCGVHCVVFTYFAATAKWVQHAIQLKQLDPSLLAPTRSFRAQAFPAAISAIAIVFLAAFAGAGADNYGGLWRPAHHVLAIAALVVNALVALIEYRAIFRNGRLIDTVLAAAAAGDRSAADLTSRTSEGNAR